MKNKRDDFDAKRDTRVQSTDFVNCVKMYYVSVYRVNSREYLAKFSSFEVEERKKKVFSYFHSCIRCIDRVENRVIISIFIRNLFTLRYS